MSTQTLDRPDTKIRPADSDGDHDRFKHFIPKSSWERAFLNGEEATALCGKKLLPVNDPDKYEMCPSCEEKYLALAE